ncbi:MAG: DUF362 domain-containing protein [Candidatus Verstraetearchaeota archaeon]|nr:DUF362 domain-containing protein [Candidatus Verstraetearchaeota archaeon]
MSSEVHFFDLGKWRNVLEGIDGLLKTTVGSDIGLGDRVAIKVHFGERGNYTYIRPVFVRRVVDFVKGRGGLPFVTDTTTLYPEGFRTTVKDELETARYNGFSEEGLGCPVVIADEPDGYGGLEFRVDGAAEDCRVKTTKVAKHIVEADAVIVLSHVKGHLLSGMGGAIKHLGMGCTTKDSKREQHAAHGLLFNYEKCKGCGECVEACKFSALEMQGERPARDEEKCMYCNTCMFTCDNKAITLYEDGKDRFQEALAHAAAGAVKALSGRPVIYLNFILDVTPLCDCAAPAGRLITQNVGILASRDPVAIDRASLDLVDKAAIMPGWEATPPDILGKINRTRSTIHIEAAERLGIGRSAYTIFEGNGE